MSKSISALFVILATLTFTGCGAQPGKSMITYARGKTPPPLITASEAGNYALYPATSANAVVTMHLDAGDEYGFMKADDGKVYAVAKGKQIPLESLTATSYYWKYRGTTMDESK